MILLDRVAEILAALVFALILFSLILFSVSESFIAGLEERIERIEINCSDQPTQNALKIFYKGNTVYCSIQEVFFTKNNGFKLMAVDLNI